MQETAVEHPQQNNLLSPQQIKFPPSTSDGKRGHQRWPTLNQLKTPREQQLYSGQSNIKVKDGGASTTRRLDVPSTAPYTTDRSTLQSHRRRQYTVSQTDSSPTAYALNKKEAQMKRQFQEMLSFSNMDLYEEEAFQEPEYIRQHRDEYEMFLLNRPDLMSQHKNRYYEEPQRGRSSEGDETPHYAKTLSPISTYYQPKRCRRFVRNFGPQIKSLYKEREGIEDGVPWFTVGSQIFKNHSLSQSQLQLSSRFGNGPLTTKSMLKLMIPTLDKEKLRQDLNSLIAYRHRKQQILKKLEADLSQLKFTISQTKVFSKQQTDQEDAYLSARRLCCSDSGSPQRLTSSNFNQTLTSELNKPEALSQRNVAKHNSQIKLKHEHASLPNWDLEVFSHQLVQQATSPRNIYSKKSQFGQNPKDQVEQLKNLQLAQTADVFSCIDLEFRKASLTTKLQTKLQEIDECQFENSSLLHQFEQEKKQSIVNKKQLLEIMPDFEEQEAMDYKFQYISSMNNFRKFVAQHTIKERRDEIAYTHRDHQEKLSQMAAELREERESLHYMSHSLQAKEQSIEILKHQISELKYKQNNLAETKKQWIRYLKIKHREYKLIKTLRSFVLIQKLNSYKLSPDSPLTVDDDKQQPLDSSMKGFNIKELSPELEEERNKIFMELNQIQIQLTQLTDFRGFCNLILQANQEDLEKFFEQDEVYTQLYIDSAEIFESGLVIKIYNDSQFFITSLRGCYQFLMEKKEQKLSTISDLQHLKSAITLYSDEIIDYLSIATIAERNQLDLTVQDLFLLKQIQKKSLCETKENLQQLIPQVKSFILSILKVIQEVDCMVKSKLDEEQYRREFSQFILANTNQLLQSGSGKIKMPFVISVEPPQAETIYEEQQTAIEPSSLVTPKANLAPKRRTLHEGKKVTNTHVNKSGDKLDVYPYIGSNTNRQRRESVAIKNFDQGSKGLLQRKPSSQNLSKESSNVIHLPPEKPKNSAIFTPRMHTVREVAGKIKQISRGLVQRKKSLGTDSNLTSLSSNFKEDAHMQRYLRSITQQSQDALEKIGIYIKQFKLAIEYLSKEVTQEQGFEIDYPYYEKVYHETRYLRHAMAAPRLDHFTHSTSTTPWGGVLGSGGFNQSFNQGGGSVMANGILPFPEYQSYQQMKAIEQASGDESPSNQQQPTDRTAKTAATERRRNILRNSYQGSELMNEKFKRLRNLQMFECRERAFLKEFKKRIHDSYNY